MNMEVESNDVECSERYEDIEEYLITSRYPENCVGNHGKKKNFRRLTERFVVKDGELRFKHKTKRTSKDGKYYILLQTH